MMREDKDSQMLFLLELLHDLVRETDALQSAVKRELLVDDSKGRKTKQGAPNREDGSFYQDLEWRMAGRELGWARTTEALNLIIRQIHFYGVMVHNFLGAITRDQPLSAKKAPVKLAPLIEEVVDLFRFSASDKEVELRIRAMGNPILVFDRELIHRALVNVVENAIKYSYSGVGRFILIESRRHSIQGDWMISVASYGVGITEDEISSGYVFQYGARGELSQDRGRSGTGIGLAEAKRIVEAHHGKIQVQSRNVTGDTFLTTVRIILPNARAAP